MPRKARILTTCFQEEYKNCTPEDNLNTVKEMLDGFYNEKPDLICLPEVFLESGVRNRTSSKDMGGVLLETLSQKAKYLNSYIIAGTYDYVGDDFCNAAWLIDRSGNLAGRYIKHYPTSGEMEKGIKPGSEVPVFQTDFGKVGILICFDIDWPEIWSTMAAKGAELVVWVSAYEGGFPLRAYAATNFYHVVSSVRVNMSKIIDNSGKILATTSKWMNWVTRELDMESRVFHLDGNFGKIYDIKKRLGDRVSLECLWEEGRFTLESNDDEWSVDRIMEEFCIETFRQYHERTGIIQEKNRLSLQPKNR